MKTIGDATIYLGDCREVLKELGANSIDAIVTDPPYGLEFMGKAWDTFTGAGMSRPGIGERQTNWPSFTGSNTIRCRTCGLLIGHGGSPCPCKDPKPYSLIPSRLRAFQDWCETWAIELYRVLKPGGHLLSFGGTRTYHRMASAIEDAGFEIRDQIGWLYGSGFPKSHNQHGDWEGWGTALKPAWEPIVMARKPLIGTVAANLAKWGVGALNIDGCRVGTERREYRGGMGRFNEQAQSQGFRPYVNGVPSQSEEIFVAEGRWPANIIHDGSDEVLAAFPQARGQIADASSSDKRKTQNVYGAMERGNDGAKARDSGGSATRFFYCAKASKADRDDGVRSAPKPVVTFATANGTSGKPSSISEGRNTEYRNTHPTVKPTDLMRYLCRLVTPPGGTVLDPFMGSGSTGRGAVLEGFSFIGIEMSAEYFDIADARIAAVTTKQQELDL